MTDGLTIAEASERLGMTSHTLRYYERAGLLLPIQRTEGGLRRYQKNDVDFLRFLACLRATGMPIRKIRQYAECVRDGAHTMAERRELLEEHRVEVNQQIELLQRNLEALNLKIRLYDEGWLHGESPATVISEKLRCLLEEKE